MRPRYFRVLDTGGEGRAWFELRTEPTGSVSYEFFGELSGGLPDDARIIGDYLDRPYPDDPMPLYDEAARLLWKRRNFIRNYGTEAYRRPPDL